MAKEALKIGTAQRDEQGHGSIKKEKTVRIEAKAWYKKNPSYISYYWLLHCNLSFSMRVEAVFLMLLLRGKNIV